jgi:hypothetical protein
MERAEQLAYIIKWFEASVHRYPSLKELKQLCTGEEDEMVSKELSAKLGVKVPMPERSYYAALKRLREDGKILVFRWPDGEERAHLLTVEEKGMLEYFDESIKVAKDAASVGYGNVGEGFKRLKCTICGLEAEWNERTGEFAWLILGPQGLRVKVGGGVASFSVSGLKVPSHEGCELYRLSTQGSADFKKLKEVKFVATSERYKDALEYIRKVSWCSQPDRFEYVILLARLDDVILPLLEKMARTGNPVYISEAAHILSHILLNFRESQRYITIVRSVEGWLREIFNGLAQLWSRCEEDYSLLDITPSYLVSSVLKCVMLAWDSGIDEVCNFITSHIERFSRQHSHEHAKAWHPFDWSLYNPFADYELRRTGDLYVRLWRKRAELLNHPDPKVRDIAYYYMPRP